MLSGDLLGPYRVLDKLGEGGMGQVFRATDTRLKRSVALKVLPTAVASDAERLARFQREAEVLASLNHPNIAQIYGLEKSAPSTHSAGSGQAGITALVMELVEGDDLSQRLARGAMPLEEALSTAKQIADALEAAHEHGIVHRDLKPANIKIRSDGVVKVLDFGLAKAVEGAGGAGRAGTEDLAKAPTITSPALMTGAGMILGTAAYMAPEQARGLADVDKRADLWAFGVVVWEMLTGQRLFVGATVSDTLAAVLKTEPVWTALPSATPAALRRLLRRCLEKDRKRRLESAADARLEIEEAMAAPTADTGTIASVPSSAPRQRRVSIALAAAAMVGALAAAALTVPALRHLREVPPLAPPETRLDIVTPATTDPVSFALSPDGRQVVFVASGDGASRLWVRSLSTITAQPLGGTEGASYPFWSPDSRAVGFFAGGQLKRINLGGGAPQTLAPALAARGGTWNADGVILFTPTPTSPLFRVPASGGQAVAATTLLEGQVAHKFPIFLPDGRHVLFFAPAGTPDMQGIYLGTLDAPNARRLTSADSRGVYLPSGPGRADPTSLAERAASGWLLWVRTGTLVAQRLDLTAQALTGDPLTLADSVAVDGPVRVSAVSVSATGLMAYRTGVANRRQLTWVDRTGKPVGTLGAPDDAGLLDPSLSPEGRRVAVSRTVQGNQDIWLLDGTLTSRFTFDPALERYSVWSPDGSQIVFGSNRAAFDLYQKSASGARAETRLVASAQTKIPTDWSADGRFLLYESSGPQTGTDLWVLPLTGDRPSTRSAGSGSTVGSVEPPTTSGRPEPAEGGTPQVWLRTPFSELAGRFSPDGRWVAYSSDESGRTEIYIRPFVPPSPEASADKAAVEATAPVTSVQWQVSTAGGTTPVWRPDGRALYYLAPDGTMMAAPIAVTGPTQQPGRPVALFPTRIVGGGGGTALGRQYDVAADGRFLINTVVDDAAAPITLIQNWQQPEPRK